MVLTIIQTWCFFNVSANHKNQASERLALPQMVCPTLLPEMPGIRLRVIGCSIFYQEFFFYLVMTRYLKLKASRN